MYKGLRVAVVVPARDEERHVGDVVRTVPPVVDHVVVVDDGSRDATAQTARSAAGELAGRPGAPRVDVLTHATSRGVGGAVLTGHRHALEAGADVLVVMAGDGQMDPERLCTLVDPIADDGYGFTKANRFFAIGSFDGMPRRRVLGNVLLSFLTKAASGYWQLFDPQNGYTAVHRDALSRIPLERIRTGYEFENDLLIHLNIARVRAKDVPVPARYGDEVSGLQILRVALRLSGLLFTGFWRRIWWKYVLQSFSPVALLLFSGLGLVSFGLLVGVFVVVNTLGPATASAGTVLMSAAPLLSGLHLLIFALMLDIQESGA